MNTVVMEFVLTTIVLAAIAWLCVKLSRPIFLGRWAKITSQTVATVLLMMVYVLSKGMAQDDSSSEAETELILILAVIMLVLKSIAIYLIACYAKSVNKSPYWAFAGVVNFLIALPLLIFGLWRSKKQVVEPHATK